MDLDDHLGTDENVPDKMYGFSEVSNKGLEFNTKMHAPTQKRNCSAIQLKKEFCKLLNAMNTKIIKIVTSNEE